MLQSGRLVASWLCVLLFDHEECAISALVAMGMACDIHLHGF